MPPVPFTQLSQVSEVDASSCCDYDTPILSRESAYDFSYLLIGCQRCSP